jgi:hypothetical protein|tara:strand:- start:775 stop:1068 length:294 start_codon:yes stop_codon:yes gene_type:complete
MFEAFMASVAGNIAQNMLGGGKGGGGGTPQIEMPRTLSIRGGRMRPTGRRSSQATRSVAAKVASPSVYGGGMSRYNSILKAMLREQTTIKAAKAKKA